VFVPNLPDGLPKPGRPGILSFPAGRPGRSHGGKIHRMTMASQQQLTDEQVVELRKDKVELNRHARRMTGMKAVCKGKSDGVLECETREGRCPEFDTCHKS